MGGGGSWTDMENTPAYVIAWDLKFVEIENEVQQAIAKREQAKTRR